MMNCQSITGATLPWYDCTINGMPIFLIIAFAMVGIIFFSALWSLLASIFSMRGIIATIIQTITVIVGAVVLFVVLLFMGAEGLLPDWMLGPLKIYGYILIVGFVFFKPILVIYALFKAAEYEEEYRSRNE